MKKVARAIRLLVNDDDKETILCDSATVVLPEKQGYYEHNNEIYEYFATQYYVDYFHKIIKPLDIGIEIREK